MTMRESLFSVREKISITQRNTNKARINRTSWMQVIDCCRYFESDFIESLVHYTRNEPLIGRYACCSNKREKYHSKQ